ncbi:MAG: ATPase, T2SS/T4P/T4SS family, partial [Marinobacter sp.]
MDTDTELQPQDAPLGRLPFTFAKRNGVILTRDDDGDPVILVRPGAGHSALAEANRISGGRARFSPIDPARFDAALNAAYQNDSAEAMQMVEGIGDDMDLASLADSVPETEDLLEQEDDAPIIRLINAILTEAVKTSASDVHIETYETRLVVRFRVDGVLREVVQPKRALAPLLVSRIKVM